jgi:hypothetical protein
MISQECSGEAYNVTKIKTFRYLNNYADLESLEFEVPMICLVTGCVSLRRDRR